ncbi:MAG: putative ABC transporter permease subunit [Meiothermus ruber]|jgi:ABC-2 type transport system permease protein|uniref:putative ABC transporter permease subunit n=1 Tax=Meiothermus ruber TaxID=277 RepID=UPI00391A92A4
MLTLRIQLVWNGLRQAPASALVGLLLGAVLAYGAWWSTSWFLSFISNELFGSGTFVNRLAAAFTRDVLVDRILGSLLLVLSSSVVLSALPNAVAVLYTSEDLPLHLTLPQKASRVFLFKVGEVFVTTALLPMLLVLPVLFAYGAHYGAPPIFFLGAALLMLALFAFPVVLGVGLALPLVRFAPAGRAREWAAALGAVLGGLLIFLLRALRPEVLLQTNFANPEELDRFLQTFRDPTAPFLPSALAQQALKGLVRGEIEAQFWLLLALSGGLLLLAGLVAGYAYQQGWVRALEGTVRERGLVRPGLLDRWAMNSRVGALWARDLRLFFRDANQASQLILVGVLVLLYTTSLQYLPLGDTRFQVVAGFLHLAFQGFVIGGVGVRLAYPLLSLEGPGYWMLQTGPVAKHTILLTRFGLALFFLLPLGLALGYFSPRVIGLDDNLTQVSVVLGLASALTAAALGVGLGAAFPKFDAANPAEVPIGMGGFLYMGFMLLHAGFLVLLASRPVYLAITQRQTSYLASEEGPLWLLIVAAATLIPLVLALWFGYRRMGER